MILRTSVDDRFEIFHRANPAVYAELVTLARKVRSGGRSHYSITALAQALRWHRDLVTSDTTKAIPFKIDNDYLSRYARLISEQELDLKDFFEFRQLREAA